MAVSNQDGPIIVGRYFIEDGLPVWAVVDHSGRRSVRRWRRTYEHDGDLAQVVVTTLVEVGEELRSSTERRVYEHGRIVRVEDDGGYDQVRWTWDQQGRIVSREVPSMSEYDSYSYGEGGEVAGHTGHIHPYTWSEGWVWHGGRLERYQLHEQEGGSSIDWVEFDGDLPVRGEGHSASWYGSSSWETTWEWEDGRPVANDGATWTWDGDRLVAYDAGDTHHEIVWDEAGRVVSSYVEGWSGTAETTFTWEGDRLAVIRTDDLEDGSWSVRQWGRGCPPASWERWVPNPQPRYPWATAPDPGLPMDFY